MPGAGEQHRAARGQPRAAGHDLAHRHQVARREHPLADGPDDVPVLPQRRRHVLDDDVGGAGEGAVHLPGVRLVRADGDDDGAGAHQRTVEQRLAGGRRADDDVGRRHRSRPRLGGERHLGAGLVERRYRSGGAPGHEVGDPGQPPAPVQRRGQRLDVRHRLRARAEDGDRERRVVPRQRGQDRGDRHGRRPQGGQRRAVEQRRGRQGGRVEQQVEALDPGQAERGVAGRDCHDLDAGSPRSCRRHEQHLPRPGLHDAPRRRRRRGRARPAARPRSPPPRPRAAAAADGAPASR